ncbi:MAG: GIY-YIG nuclease family protein [Geminicoccaceae bacterium]
MKIYDQRVRGLLQGKLIDAGQPIVGGIYLLTKADEVVYVGKAKNIYRRIAEHCKKKKAGDFDRFYYIEIDDARERSAFEAKLIRALRPALNGVSERRGGSPGKLWGEVSEEERNALNKGRAIARSVIAEKRRERRQSISEIGRPRLARPNFTLKRYQGFFYICWSDCRIRRRSTGARTAESADIVMRSFMEVMNTKIGTEIWAKRANLK